MFHNISKYLSILIKFQNVSAHMCFPEFQFKFEFESGEVSITKVVPYIKLYHQRIYPHFSRFGS
jgi:hypothetical protein